MAAKVKRIDFSRRAKWLRLLFIAFLVYFSVIIINQHLTLRTLRERQQEVQTEIEQLDVANRSLKAQINLLKTEPGFIEGYARRELGLVREGETVYILPQWNIDK